MRVDRPSRAGSNWPAGLALALGVSMLAACGGGAGSSPAAATGSLTASDCAVPAGAPLCQAAIAWTTSSASAPRLVVGGRTMSTAAAGRFSYSVGERRVTVALYDGEQKLGERTIGAACEPAGEWVTAVCREYARRMSMRAPTPFTEAGAPVSLEVVVYRPPGIGPFPAMIFHHGSTGNGDDPSLFRITWTSEAIARYFVERGWIVAFPQRRGRGASDGLYDEGFTADRSRYSCEFARAQAGLERAVDDAQVSLEFVASLPDVDASRLLVGGTSRGGVVALVHAARNPGRYRGALNFVGGWLGEGCGDALAVNRNAFVAAAVSTAPARFLYAERDTFYSVAYSRANFEAFAAAGGQGEFAVYERAAGLNGHFLVNEPKLWSADLDPLVSAAAS